jgi:hypothetical protein
MEPVDLTTFELNAAMRQTASALLDANRSLRLWSRDYAKRHSTFKKRHAQCRLASERKTDDQRKAEADYETADELLRSDLADGMRQAELERVRSLRAILSSLQTEANGNKEEMKYYGTGPQYEK